MRIDLVGTTADFRRFGHPQPLPINHLLCENRRTQGRMGEVGLRRWRKDPEYEKAHNALEEEFALAAAMIEARARAGLTQQLAERMHTTQAVIARLESGRVKPSTRTLERLAAATGMQLRISFEPAVRS
jgi:ribosome-binding protein aMBF1 (putative translation factor)